MKEWTSQYNPFNSQKILMWKEHLEACVKGDFLTPAMIDLDPSGKCNFSCLWCNADEIIDNHRPDLPEEHWTKLIDFVKDWADKTLQSCCVSGGGEPFMNKATPSILEKLHSRDIEIGVISNASLWTDRDIDILAKTCRWVGVSVDASTKETYNYVKGIKGDLFNKIKENIKKLTTRIEQIGKRNCQIPNDVGFKFLLSPYNYKEIYDSAVLARDLGVRDFHLRPVGFLNIPKLEGQSLSYTPEILEEIDKQVEQAMTLENGYFRVFGIRHKFSPDFQPKRNFTKCWTIPMLPTFGADGNVHTCFDMRGRKDLIMCKHFEIKDFWNTEAHKNLVKNIDIKSCPRCTFGVYNEVAEKVFYEDNMCRRFL